MVDNMSPDLPTKVPVWEKYSLSIAEAAEYFGIGENRLRSLINVHREEDYILEVGAHVRIKRRLFEVYLDRASIA